MGLLDDVPADDLKPDHLKRYFVYCFERPQLSENTMHSRINAIKYYYEQVLRREKFFWEIPRPKNPLQLPRFFSQDDIISIIKATENLKHKVMLMLALCYLFIRRLFENFYLKHLARSSTAFWTGLC